jgi:biotin transport system substrate-specific component
MNSVALHAPRFVLGDLLLTRLTRHRATVALVAGTAIVYLFGATGLAVSLHLTAAAALRVGVLPFLLGDALKVAIAAGPLPAAWRRCRPPR